MGRQKSDLDLRCRGVLLSGAAVWFVLGSALVSRTPARGQEAPQDGPVILKSGGLLQPTVTVERHGRLLVLTYGPKSADGGQLTTADPRGEPPGFTVYQGQRKIASGQFEYG
jgi:hypothetical protein